MDRQLDFHAGADAAAVLDPRLFAALDDVPASDALFRAVAGFL